MSDESPQRDTESIRKGRDVRIVIGGASGFLGTALSEYLIGRGDDVVHLVRRAAAVDQEVQWDPAAGSVDLAVLEGADAVVNLGGVGIGDSRWSEDRKEAILQSRLQATATLAAAISSLSTPPRVFVSASAIGFYGDRGDETLTEQSNPGPESDFLVQVAKRWEEAALPVVAAGVPLAFLRTGIVLGDGGVLSRLLLPFKVGVGGPMGSGKQWWSWITLEDQVRATVHIIDRRLSGAFNLTAPNPVRNKEFAKSLGRALHRPALLPVPAFSLKALLGAGRAQALVFTSARILPQALKSSGFQFTHESLESAWPAVLGKGA